MQNKQYSEMTMKLRRLVLASAVCVNAHHLPMAYAQGALEEIIVTASKKGETSLMSTAVSATVVTGDQLEFREIRNAEELQTQTPGLVSDTTGVSPKLAIRGVGHDSFLLSAESGVTIYADNVLLGRPNTIAGSFFDFERVDVLKGPQGTSFGRNSTGGSVNFVSRRPQEGTSGEVGLLGGSFDRKELHGIFNHGTSDWGMRIAAKYSEDDGYGTNLFNGEDVAGTETIVIKSALSFSPTDTFEALLRIDHTSDDHTGPLAVLTAPEPFATSSFFGATRSTDENEKYEINNDLHPELNREMTLASLNLDWQIGELNLRSITGYLDADSKFAADADASDIALVQTPINAANNQQFSQEFILSGSAGSLDWLAGAYYLNEDAEDYSFVLFALDYNPQGGTRIGDISQETTSIAAFGSGTWHFNEDTRLTAGLRYTEDEKKFDYNDTFILGPLSPAPGFVVPLCQESSEETWDAVTWDLTLEHDFSADTFGYVKANTGFKAGGFDSFVCNTTFDEEDITAYEIGYKGTFRDGTMTLATSAFYYDYDDLQVNQLFVTETGVPAFQIQNAAAAEVYGLEIELRSLLSDSFSVDFGFSWVPTAEYTDYERTDELDVRVFTQSGVPVDPLDLSGQRLNRSPEYSGVAGLNFNSDLGGDWRMDARLEIYFVDDIAYSAFDRPNAFNASIGVVGPENKDTNIQEAYELLNLYASFHYGDNWTIRAYGKNLTDEYYSTSLEENGATGETRATLARPREGGVQVIYRFTD